MPCNMALSLTLVALALFTPDAAASTLTVDAATSLQERPVMKIVRMLEDMKSELTADMEDDKAVMEKLDCWCTSNEKAKTEAIALGKSNIASLESTIGETAAKIQELKAKRASTMAEMSADQKALDNAEELRMKESKDFSAEENYLMDSISSAKNAITVLGEHHPELAQLKSMALQLKKARVSELIVRKGTLGKFRAQALNEFLQGIESAKEDKTAFLSIPGMQSYAPQSGQIFGILKQMVTDFEADLSDAQKKEMKAKEDFAMLKAAKEDEIAAAQKTVVEIDADLAEFGEKHVVAEKDLADTQEQLALDEEFLENLRTKCANADEEFDARMKSRLEEIAAVEDTIKILNDDKAFDQFTKTVNTFLQTNQETSQQQKIRRQRAVSVLQRAAGRALTPKLAMLATSAQLDAFTKVKAEIDKMVAELTKQQEDEIAHRDWCIENKNKNARETKDAYDRKAALETKIADLTKSIETLTAELDASAAAISSMKEEMKRSSEIREGENAEFQQTVTDQRVTQMILNKALERMKQVYVYELVQQPGAPHIQTSATHTDPGNGPAKFKDNAAKNSGGNKVVAMLEDVLADSRKTEDDAIAAEDDAQTAYEQFMKDSNKSITEHMKKITDMTEARAKNKASLSMAKTDFASTMKELEGLNTVLGDLNKQCDYVLNNFEARQAARAAEMDALKEAKAILSGAQ